MVWFGYFDASNNKCDDYSFKGFWFSKDLELEAKEGIDGTIQVDWVVNNTKYRLGGIRNNGSAKVSYYVMKFDPIYMKETSFEIQGIGYMYLSNMGNELNLMIDIRDSEEIMYFHFSKK